MPAQSLTEETTALVIKDFGLGHGELPPCEDEIQLKEQLTKLLRYLLDKDFSRLINACYRIDIPETLVKSTLHNEAPDQIAPTLADIILAREKKKVLLRRKYSGY